MAWRFATWPTRRSPLLVNPTTDGVVRPPSSLGITLGSPPSITATTEFVVPKSIPIIFAIAFRCSCGPHSPRVRDSGFRLALESIVVKLSDAPIHQLDSGESRDGRANNPTQAKTGLEWGTVTLCG